MVGATEAAERFTGFSINESTVRTTIKKAYLAKRWKKRIREEDNLAIYQLHIKKKAGHFFSKGNLMMQCRNSC